jgi:hypothetical protein
MPKGWFTSGAGGDAFPSGEIWLSIRYFASHLGLEWTNPGGNFVTPFSGPSWSRFFEEFHCRGCGFQDAYRSRPRGFFEKHVLPLLLLQTVRCERCYHRRYIFFTVPVLEHVPPDGKMPRSEPNDGSHSDSRVA